MRVLPLLSALVALAVTASAAQDPRHDRPDQPRHRAGRRRQDVHQVPLGLTRRAPATGKPQTPAPPPPKAAPAPSPVAPKAPAAVKPTSSKPSTTSSATTKKTSSGSTKPVSTTSRKPTTTSSTKPRTTTTTKPTTTKASTTATTKPKTTTTTTTSSKPKTTSTSSTSKAPPVTTKAPPVVAPPPVVLAPPPAVTLTPSPATAPLPTFAPPMPTSSTASSSSALSSTSTGCPPISGGILPSAGSSGVSASPTSSVAAKTADGPAPTRSPVPCTPTPATFSGAAVGFAELCADVRHCDPPATDRMVSSGWKGEVTRREIETLLGDLQSTGTHFENGPNGNVLSDGWIGMAAYSSGLLFETTGDRRALDVLVRIADNILATRNDPVTGRVLWTGNRELVWPTKSDTGRSSIYAGCESMHVVGHMLSAAVYILKTPCIWNLIPQATSAPSPFNSTMTYLDRAQAYVAAADETVESYFLPWFFNPQGLLIQPNDPRWNAAGDFKAGTFMPWNRQAMMLHGLIRLASAHALDPVRDDTRSARYNNLVDVNVRDFVGNLSPINSTREGTTYDTYTWYYAKKPPGGSIEFMNGIHAFYDIWGVWIAWQHGAAPDTLTDTVMIRFANTMQYQIWQPDKRAFSAYVDGQSNPCNPREAPRKNLWGAWAFYAHWVPDWYTTVTTADTSQIKEVTISAPLLWAKSAMFRQDPLFWKGAYAA